MVGAHADLGGRAGDVHALTSVHYVGWVDVFVLVLVHHRCVSLA